MDLIIGQRTMKLYNIFVRTMSNHLSNSCIRSTRCTPYANSMLQNITLTGNYLNSDKELINNRSLTNYTRVNKKLVNHAYYEFELKSAVRSYGTENRNDICEPKQTLFQKMKQMTKDYWHILVPVHVATSIVWITISYIIAKNGVDIVAILKYLHFSEYYLEKVRNSNAGHWAVAYALYKIIYPVRIAVTVGGTSIAIRYLNKWGIMKFKTPDKMKDILSSKTVARTKATFGKTDVKTKTATDSPKT